MRRQFFRFSLSLVLCGFMGMLILSCGKVTQVSNTPEEIKSFDLTYSVEVIPTATLKLKIQTVPNFPSPNVFSLADNLIYVRVLGFKKEGKQKDELSWGRAILKLTPKVTPFLAAAASANSTVNKAKFSSVAFNKTGIELSVSDHTWSKIDWDETASLWKGGSKKIDRKYPFYMVQVFSDKNKYAMKYLDQSVVTGNKVWDLGMISTYDTFLSILLLKQWEERNDVMDYKGTIERLSQLFPAAFFQTLGYRIPENEVKRFDPSEPVFICERRLEKSLIKIFNWVQTDKGAALTYLQQLPTDVLSLKSKELLNQCIQNSSPSKTK